MKLVSVRWNAREGGTGSGSDTRLRYQLPESLRQRGPDIGRCAGQRCPAGGRPIRGHGRRCAGDCLVPGRLMLVGTRRGCPVMRGAR
jgi:hypothetical protein